MPEWVADSLLTVVTIITCMVLLSLALSAIVMVTGEGANPGMLDTFLKGLSGNFVKLG